MDTASDGGYRRRLFQQIGGNIALKVVRLDMGPFATFDFLDDIDLGALLEGAKQFAAGGRLFPQMRVGMRNDALNIGNGDGRLMLHIGDRQDSADALPETRLPRAR